MVSLTHKQIDTRKQEAIELVKHKAKQSAIAAAIPVPFFDMGTDIKLMTEIEEEINDIFEVSDEEMKSRSESLKTRIAIMLSSSVGEFIARKTTKTVLKQFQKRNKRTKIGPITVSSVVSHGTNAIVSYALMRKLGMDHIEKVVEYLNNQIVD